MIRAYLRVSTSEQASSDKTSLDRQRQCIIGAAMMRGVIESEIAFYTDPGVSGSVSLRDRPDGGRLMTDLQHGDIVISAKLDRLFRSASDALATVESLHAQGVGVVLADIGPDSVTENGTSKLFFSMLAAFAEFERNRIAERMTDGRRAKRKNGGHIGGIAPYGYRAIGKGGSAVLIPHEDEQRVIRLVHDLNTTRSPRQIVAELDRRGIRNRVGNPILHNQIVRILKRPIMTEAAE